MKKRFIFDEKYIKKYVKKERLRALVIGALALGLILVVIIVVIATKNNAKPILTPSFDLKDELVVESGSPVPEVADYFVKLENIDAEDIKITYLDKLELSYDLVKCSDEEVEEINNTENVDMSKYSCALGTLKTPNVYGVIVRVLENDYQVNLRIQDTIPPVVLTNTVEIYEGETYKLEDFVNACVDENDVCKVDFITDDKDSDGNLIDYTSFKEPGDYKVKMKAVDAYDNETEVIEVDLKIKEVAEELLEVTFNSNGGSDVSSIKVLKGEAIEEPKAPTREGYNFLGWYIGNAKFDFDTIITENLTLKANWQKATTGGNPSGGGQPSGEVAVSSVYLNYKKISLFVDQTKTVTATVRPSNATNKTVTWSSANNNIATVKNGQITGVGEGTTTITAKAGGKSASVTVVVQNKNSSGTTCSYGSGNYDSSRYILSVNLTRNGCAVNPNMNYNESISQSDYTSSYNELLSMGFNLSDTSSYAYSVKAEPVKNTEGTGLVGYQIRVTWSIVDQYIGMTAEYIIKSDGSRSFIQNNIRKNNVKFK